MHGKIFHMKRMSIPNCLLIVLLFVALRLSEPLSNLLNVSELTVSVWLLSLIALVNCLLMGPVIQRHIRRVLLHSKITIMFYLIGTAVFFCLLYGTALVGFPSPFNIVSDMAHLPLTSKLLLLLAICVLLPFVETTVYKALTDRLPIAYNEVPTMLLSALLFGLVNCLALMPLNLMLFPIYFLVCSGFGLVIAYIYNQTTSLMVSEMALSLAIFLFHIGTLWL